MHFSWKASRPIRVLAALLFILTGVAKAQTTGKIEGRVFDAATNQPLSGAQVVVVGTGLGNITNRDGYYFINNVPAGVHDIRAQYIGYEVVTVTGQRVLSGQTARVDFRMPAEAVQIEAITVQGEGNPLVPRDKTVTKAIVTGDIVQQLPVDNVQAVVSLQPGVVDIGDGRGQVIRGGRPGEASVYVDGVLVRNFNSGSQSRLNVGTNALEEVNLLTGGYGAEYGSAQSGIINYISKQGASRYSGALNFRTDAFLPKDISWGVTRAEASLGGPLMGEKLTFHLAATAQGYEDAAPNFLNMSAQDTIPVQQHYFIPTGREQFRDASGNPVLGSDGQPLTYTTFKQITGQGKRQPFSNQDRFTGSGTLHWTLGKNTRASFGAMTSRNQGLNGFNSLQQFLPKAIDAFVNKSQLFRVGLDQILFQTAESQATIKFNVAYGKDIQRAGQRADTAALVPEGPDFLGFRVSDYKFLYENKATIDAYLARMAEIRAGTAAVPLTLVETLGLTPAEATGQFDFDYGADNPYGILGYHWTKGLGGYYEAQEKTLTFDVDLDWQANRIHRFGAGFEMYRKTVENNSFSKLGGTTFDNVYRVKPVIGALWVKDRMDIGEMVLDIGLRYDHFDSDARYSELPGLVLPFTPDNTTAGLALCETPPAQAGQTCNPKFTEQAPIHSLSPRLGVAFPVTESTNFRLSYGHFFQIPALTDLFSGINTDISKTNVNMPFGRALKAMKAVQFEVGLSHTFNSSTVLDVTAYNKDKLADATYRIINVPWPASRRGAQDARLLTGLDFGNTKGLDARMTRRLTQAFTTIVGYSYLNARGTGSDPLSYIRSFGRFADPITGAPLSPAQALQYADFDQRHKFSLAMTASFDRNESNALLRNTNVAITSLAGSGLPYTHSSTPGASGRGASGARYTELINSSRMPWTFNADLRLTRGVTIGNTNISLVADARNLLNTRNQTNVYGYTGSPTDPGDIVTQSGGAIQPDLTIEKVANVESRLQYQRQQDILKLYGLADADDAVLSTAEQKRARGLDYIASKRIETFYGTPRQLRLGFEWVF